MAVKGMGIPESPIRFGDVELDASACELRRGRRTVKFERIPLQVLLMLIEQRGRVVTRDAIADQIWGKDVFVDVDSGINTAIRKIRQILNDDPQKPRFVETIPGVGYRFIAPVSAVSETLPAESALEPTSAAAPSSTRRMPRWYVGVAACLLPLAIVGIWLGARYRQADLPIRSLAVMPLEDLSPGTREDYFADGMTDELITELAQIPGLRIVSRMSVMRDKGTREPLAQVARELKVDAIVEGSVVRSGDRVRITAQLIDARSDKHLWAQSFEGSLGNVLSLQDNVAREITSQTRTALTPAARAELTNAKPVNPEAHDAYLRGLYFINRREGVLAASYFRQAITLQPDYAVAQAGFAEALATQLIAGQGSADAMPSATAAAKRAIELDPNCGEAYTALGAIDTTFRWDWNAAEQNLLKGIALSPSSSHAESWFAYYLITVNRPAEAVEATQRAVELDPLSFWANRNLGMALYYARRYDESLAALQRASELAPDKPKFVAFWQSADYEMKSSYADAVNADLKLFIDSLSPADIDSLRSAFETGGWRSYQEARVKVLTPRADGDVEKWDNMALSYLHLGKVTEAFHWFNREVDEHSVWVLFMPVDPRVDNIRTDPHYTALLSRMNLPRAS